MRTKRQRTSEAWVNLGGLGGKGGVEKEVIGHAAKPVTRSL
jgi:hypothetical protein